MKKRKTRTHIKTFLVASSLVVLVTASLNLDLVLYVGANSSPQYISDLCKDTLIRRAPQSDLALAYYVRVAAGENSYSTIGNIVDSFTDSDKGTERLLSALKTVDEGNFISAEMHLFFVARFLKIGQQKNISKNICITLNNILINAVEASLESKKHFSRREARLLGSCLRLRNSVLEYIHSSFEDSRAFFEFRDSLRGIKSGGNSRVFIKDSISRIFDIGVKVGSHEDRVTERLTSILQKKSAAHGSFIFEGLLYRTVLTSNQIVGRVKALEIDPLVVFDCKFCLLFLHHINFLERDEFLVRVINVYKEIEVVISQTLIDKLEAKTISEREIVFLTQFLVFNDYGRRSIYQWFRDKVNHKIYSSQVNSVALGILLGECQKDSAVSDEEVVNKAIRLICHSDNLSLVKVSYQEFSRFASRGYNTSPGAQIPASKKKFFAKAFDRLEDQLRNLKE